MIDKLKEVMGIPQPTLEQVMGIKDPLLDMLQKKTPVIPPLTQWEEVPAVKQKPSMLSGLKDKIMGMKDKIISGFKKTTDVTPAPAPQEPSAGMMPQDNQTPYEQLNVKRDVVKNYGNWLTKDAVNLLDSEHIKDWTVEKARSSQYNDSNLVGPRPEGGGTIDAVQIPESPEIWTNASVPPHIIMHEVLHKFMEKGDNIITGKSQGFDEAWDKYKQKNAGTSNPYIEKMNSIDQHLDTYYTQPGTSEQKPADFSRATERFAYLGEDPNNIPPELKDFYKKFYNINH